AHGLQFQASYTYSRATDTTSEATAVGGGDTNQNGPSKSFAKGRSRFDTPHRLTVNGSYLLPFFADRNDVVGRVFGAWQISAVLKLASGTPFSVTDSSVSRDIDFDGFADSIRPVILDRSVLGAHVNNPDTSQQALPRTAFRTVDFTDTLDMIAPRNAFWSAGTRNVDAVVGKIVRMPWAGQTMSVRLEAYNVFNTVKFGLPTSDISNANFGKILGGANTYSPRTLQLVLRYRY